MFDRSRYCIRWHTTREGGSGGYAESSHCTRQSERGIALLQHQYASGQILVVVSMRYLLE
jgi:hypothetical protein